jgi:hypothetical protein
MASNYITYSIFFLIFFFEQAQEGKTKSMNKSKNKDIMAV